MTKSRRLAVSLASIPLLAVSLAAVPSIAHADSECIIYGFSPETVELGLSPKVKTFEPIVDGCDLTDWTIRTADYSVYTFEGNAKQVFNMPYSNADAGTQDVIVEATNSDYDSNTEIFYDGFSLKRNTTWDKFNASPEPVRKGSKITIKGRLRIVDWYNERYVGYKNRSVRLQFRTKTGSYKTVKTITSRSGGYLSTTVTAKSDGYWRFYYGGNSVAGGGATAGDFVDVK